MLYKTRGTCSIAIDVEVENGIVKHAQFINGCPDQLALALEAALKSQN